MPSKSNSSASEPEQSRPGRKLLESTFGEFLKILRDRGRGEKADELEDIAMREFSPPLDKEQLLKMTVEAITVSLEVKTLLAAMAPKPETVRSRMAGLRAEGFNMIPGEKRAE